VWGVDDVDYLTSSHRYYGSDNIATSTYKRAQNLFR
jgi:hypothetical protein